MRFVTLTSAEVTFPRSKHAHLSGFREQYSCQANDMNEPTYDRTPGTTADLHQHQHYSPNAINDHGAREQGTRITSEKQVQPTQPDHA